jgi:hypothetical protein
LLFPSPFDCEFICESQALTGKEGFSGDLAWWLGERGAGTTKCGPSGPVTAETHM